MKRWYVVQVYAGFEEAVKTDLAKRIHDEGLEDQFGEVLIPSARLKQMFEVEDSKDAQLFPGYVLIEMEAGPRTIRLVTSSLRVIKFLGGKEPVAISQKEIDRIIGQMKGEVAVATKKSEFTVGSEIDITDGPFAGFVGIIEKIDDENERVTVMVSIFGRMTPVELGFNQIK
jgi:transcription termination/antitermination protein NusG